MKGCLEYWVPLYGTIIFLMYTSNSFYPTKASNLMTVLSRSLQVSHATGSATVARKHYYQISRLQAKLTLTSTSCETVSFLTDTKTENWTNMVTMGIDTHALLKLITVSVTDIHCNLLLISISVILAQCE